MSYRPAALPLLLCAALLTPTPSAAAPAHVHGEAQLEVVVDGPLLQVQLHSPLASLLGFERAPRTAVEKQALRQLPARLGASERLFVTDAAAGCQAQPASVSLPASNARAAHAEVEVTFRWQCRQPAALRSLSTGLFAEFPSLHRLRLLWAGPTGQRAATLTAGQNRFVW